MNLQHYFAAIIVVSGFSIGSAFGQFTSQRFSPLSPRANGFHLNAASISSSFIAGANNGLLGSVPSGADTRLSIMQGTGSLDWTRNTKTAEISVRYSPSYSRSFAGSKYTSLNHALSIEANRAVGTKWQLGGSVAGVVSDFQQLLFSTSRYANLSAIPATFDELFAAFVTGRSANNPLNEAANAASVFNSPESAFHYGGRIMSTSARTTVAYAQSTRSNFNVFANISRAQNLQGGKDVPSTTPAATVPSTDSAGGGLSWSYALTPRSAFGVQAGVNRASSVYSDSLTNSVSTSLSRTLTQHFFVSGSAGVGFIRPIGNKRIRTEGFHPIFGGSIGYKVFAQTVVGSYSRSVADSYGLGAGATETSSAGWTWNRPGSSMGLNASFGYNRLLGAQFPGPGSWTAQAGVSRELGAGLALNSGYSYAQYPRTVFSAGQTLAQTGVYISVGWSPHRSQEHSDRTTPDKSPDL